MAPLALDPVRPELAPNDSTLTLELLEAHLDSLALHAVAFADLSGEKRTVGLRVAAQQITEGIIDRLGERLGQSLRQCDTEGIAEA